MSERELDIVEELRFFAQASDEETISVVMTSGSTFAAAADEIGNLRSLINACDAKDAMRQAPPSDLAHDLKAAEVEDGLRKAVGR